MAFPYPLPSPVFRQDQAKQLLSQKYSYQNLPRTPCWLDKTPTLAVLWLRALLKRPTIIFFSELMCGSLIMPLVSSPSHHCSLIIFLPLLYYLHTLWKFTHHLCLSPFQIPFPYQELSSPLSSRPQSSSFSKIDRILQSHPYYPNHC